MCHADVESSGDSTKKEWRPYFRNQNINFATKNKPTWFWLAYLLFSGRMAGLKFKLWLATTVATSVGYLWLENRENILQSRKLSDQLMFGELRKLSSFDKIFTYMPVCS